MKVVVVGAGIVGGFVSYYLKKAGHEVTLVDISPEAGRTSKSSAGFIVRASAPEPPVSMLKVLVTCLGGQGFVYLSPREMLRHRRWLFGALRKQPATCEKAVIELAGKSLDLYRAFFREETVKVDSIKRLTELYVDGEMARDAALSMGGRFLGRTDVSSLGFKNFGGGAEFVGELSVDPGQLFSELRELLTKKGVVSLFGEARLVRKQGSCDVLVDEMKVSTDVIVVAAGAWSGELCRALGYDPLILPARGLATIFDTGGAKILESPAIFEDYGVAIVQHDQNTLRATSFFELVGFDADYGERRKSWTLKVLEKHVARFSELKLVKTLVGHRPCTPDRLPVIGKVPNYDKLYISSGHCRIGITLAPVSGYLISSMLDEKQGLLDASCFSPSRFQ